jgi:murein DD-endopeptidase MepM/ murein hydrolase activator NlpD
LSKIDVQPGQAVQAGDKLGEVGTTGLSTGWHLHWEARIGATPVDPLPLLEQTLRD